MRQLFYSTLLAMLTLSSVFAAGSEWLTDFEAAKVKAKAENKHVLMDFTGSDWCPPCKALSKNVFSKEAFTTFAKEKLVLVELDFPSRKKQTAELKAANKKLQEKFDIKGYPTLVLLSPEGKELTRLFYQGENAKDFVAKLNSELKKK